MRVLVELQHTDAPTTALQAGTPIQTGELVLDAGFEPVQLMGTDEGPPRTIDRGAGRLRRLSPDPTHSTYVVRGTITDEPQAQRRVYEAMWREPEVVGVFADPAIETCPMCGDDGPIGTDHDVAELLGTRDLVAAGMDGSGVRVAVVDTGINIAYLTARGHEHDIDENASWAPPGVTTRPGRHPVGHGTMCAYDVGIAAPRATLVDHAALLGGGSGPTPMSGLLSDALAAYSKLQHLLMASPEHERRLVVSNSWGMFDPTWDFPVGHPGNYSDNPQHPFNVIVRGLTAAGADVLFAAGNCGRDCPDSRCAFGATAPICGANSHPSVTCVAGIDTNRNRLGYSSQGPGRLEPLTPSLSGYTHFSGSGVYPVDGGTSAACPVIAGYVAALRTVFSASALSPAQLHALLAKCAHDLGATGFDFDHGWGAPDTNAVLSKLH
jgi:subtilisin family serine protease